MTLILTAVLILMSLPHTAATPDQQTLAGGLPTAEAWHLRSRDNAGELFVYEIGTGKPVVVLHGGPGADLTYLLPLARGLEDRYRFVFYDQRGSLRSRFPAAAISMSQHVADLETLREALGAARLDIVSHSAGTLLALEYLTAHPDKVGNLVMVGALPHKNGRKYFDEEYALLWKGWPEAAKAFNDRDAVRAELKRAGVDQPVKTPKQQAQIDLIRQVGAESVRVDLWRSQLPMRVNPEAAQATRSSTRFEYDYSAVLAAHPYPVTVINGDLDYTVGPQGSPLWKRLTATAAANVKVVVIPDASHIVWRDQPALFRTSLRDALSQPN